MAGRKIPETDVARPVVDWYKSRGFQVYQEVPVKGTAGAADIVAVKGPFVVVVETKVTMSLALLGQARRWVGQAHSVVVAVPWHVRGSSQDGAVFVCGAAGIGLLYVSRSGAVREMVSPDFFRKAKAKPILESLRPEHADGSIPAGSAGGTAWTAWKITVRDLGEVVQRNPGIGLKQAVGMIKHHYPSDYAARRSLSKHALFGRVPGVRAEEVARSKDVRLYPKLVLLKG